MPEGQEAGFGVDLAVSKEEGEASLWEGVGEEGVVGMGGGEDG